MLELNGEDYKLFLDGLANATLLSEFIKVTVQANTHLSNVQNGIEEIDMQLVERYNMATEAVFNRMEKDVKED